MKHRKKLITLFAFTTITGMILFMDMAFKVGGNQSPQNNDFYKMIGDFSLAIMAVGAGILTFLLGYKKK